MTRLPTALEQQRAQDIREWLPKPIYNNVVDGMHKTGPGYDYLRKYDIVGYASIYTIARGRESREIQFDKINRLHAIMESERLQQRKLVQASSAMQTRKAVSEAEFEAPSQFPDFNELEERLDNFRAVQIAQGGLLVEIKGMLEKLLKELGCK